MDVHYRFILKVSNNKKSKKNNYESRGIKHLLCG